MPKYTPTIELTDGQVKGLAYAQSLPEYKDWTDDQLLALAAQAQTTIWYHSAISPDGEFVKTAYMTADTQKQADILAAAQKPGL